CFWKTMGTAYCRRTDRRAGGRGTPGAALTGTRGRACAGAVLHPVRVPGPRSRRSPRHTGKGPLRPPGGA
ncbi:MAG: hypothetical protein AVDCRST_MAG83-52, partial [uncultured Arthrobacter sp.]